MNAVGLEEVVAAETRLSCVLGSEGQLVIAGQRVEAALELSFEAQAARLLNVAFSSSASPANAHLEEQALRRALGSSRVQAFESMTTSSAALHHADPMAALRSALSGVIVKDSTRGDIDQCVALIAAVPVFVSAWWRRTNQQPPIAPSAELSHSADTLRMLGQARGQASTQALDSYFATVMDHGLNASAFAARVVCSTGSDLVSAIVAAVGALKGPLHGGAPGPVLDMLDEIAEPAAAQAWISARLERGGRIMGMGHRVYRTRDPRATVLEQALQRFSGSVTLEQQSSLQHRLRLARAVETCAEQILRTRYPERLLKANVEFFTAVLLDGLGVDRSQFSPLFAVSRVVGWCAHAIEQQATGRLLRPRAKYVGDMPS